MNNLTTIYFLGGKDMVNQYRYDIEILYEYDKNIVNLDYKQIHSLTIDYDYDNRNMPIMFLKASIDKNILDDMIKNSTTKTLTVVISKFIYNTPVKIKYNYIRDRFVYFLPKDMNIDKDLDYNNYTKDSKDLYKSVTIGLMKIENINNNKRLINDVFINTTLMNMILKYTSHMKLLIEPFRNNSPVESFIVPPISSITEYIKYLDDYFTLYPSGYRLFYDYETTYLLSGSGKAVESVLSDSYSVIINVNNTAKVESKVQGMEVDKKQKTYFVDVDAKDVNIFQDEATDKSYNTILGIGSDGKFDKVQLATENINLSVEKTRIERFPNNNLKMIDNIKHQIEDKSICVNIVKTELDTSVFTINRQYMIRNFDILGGNTGNFLLSRKREIYTLDRDNFILSSVLTFKKILS